MRKIYALMVLSLLALGACVAQVDDPTGEPDPIVGSDEVQLTMPRDHVDRKGRHWTCTGLSRFEVVSESNPLERPKAASVPDDVFVPIEQRSVEEIAEALRPVTYFELEDGRTYDCVGDPNFDRARRVKEGFSPPTEGSVDEDDGNAAVEKACCGNDDRDWENTPDLYKKVLLGEQGCTASVIGTATAWTSAHNKYNTETNAWRKVARVSSSSQDWPYYRRMLDNNPRTWEVNTCYHVFVPAGWANATDNEAYSAWVYDFSVLNFAENGGGTPCSDTSPFENWFGTWNFSDSSWVSNTLTLRRVGYPYQTNNLGGDINSPDSTLYTFAWGTGSAVISGYVKSHALTGDFNISGTYPTLIWDHVDASSGDSGAPLVYINGTSELITSTHSGTDGTKNYERRWNSTTYSFAEDNSLFPND